MQGPGRGHYVIASIPASVPGTKQNPEKPSLKVGVGALSWSFDSQFLATRNDSMPTAVWVWDLSRLSLAVSRYPWTVMPALNGVSSRIFCSGGAASCGRCQKPSLGSIFVKAGHLHRCLPVLFIQPGTRNC